jgi:recombination protein RecR
MDSLYRLEEMFSHFPGIGPRQARRFVYYLLNKSPSFIKEFTTLVEEVRKATSECRMCHRLFFDKNIRGDICTICIDTSRDLKTLMIVARDSDLETVERSGAYQGLYFVLGGTIPLLDKEPDKRIRLRSLLERVSTSSPIQEVILSLNTTPDGEHTGTIVKDALLKVISSDSVCITILGRGLSTGAELEYVDKETIKNALRNRR